MDETQTDAAELIRQIVAEVMRYRTAKAQVLAVEKECKPVMSAARERLGELLPELEELTGEGYTDEMGYVKSRQGFTKVTYNVRALDALRTEHPFLEGLRKETRHLPGVVIK